MDATFHFRKKIGCAACFRSQTLLKGVQEALTTHPWFFLAPQNEAQLVWSDQAIQPAFPEQLIVYHGLVEGVDAECFDLPLAASAVSEHKVLYIPHAAVRALKAIVQPLQQQGAIQAVQITALFPPSAAPFSPIPSLALFYQTIPVPEQEALQLIKRELERFFAPTHSMLQIQCLYAPILQGPFLNLTIQMQQPIDLAQVQAAWDQPSPLPTTPSQQSAFIQCSNALNAPCGRMQGQSCEVGQLRIEGKGLQLCLLAPDPVKSLLACSEQLVVSGAIYW